MNEELLEKLLKEKKDQVYHFGQSEEDFIAGFMEKIDHRPQKIHFWRYAAIFAEGHFPIAVERATGIDANGKRSELCVSLLVCICKKISERTFNGRCFAVVPVHTQNKGAIAFCCLCDPNVLYDSGAFDLGKREGFAGGNSDAR